MTTCLNSALALAGFVLLAGPVAARQPADAARAHAVELSFNLDHEEALAELRAAITANPDDLAAHRLMAATQWARALLRLGAMTADDFIGEAGPSFRSNQPDAGLQHSINEVTRRVEALAAARPLTGSPAEAEAAYQIGAAYRLLSSYAATIEGNQLRSLGAARRAYREHQRVLFLDPRRNDARLTVGLYRYGISTLPVWSRLVARVAGLESDREGGARLVEATAAAPGSAQANALFSLIVIYNQQARYDDALRVIGQLQRQFPRNRLLWLEAGGTALRGGRPAVARDALEHGLRMLDADTRPRAFGELARWRYHYGVALARLNQGTNAARHLRAALDGDGLDWVRGRAHLELGKLATLSGHTSARDEFQAAVRTCTAGEDAACVAEARAWLRGR